jgi:hypothetical protein
MSKLIKTLQRAMLDKGLSPEQASRYIGCTGVQIRRWIAGTSNPTPLYRDAIVNGIERIKTEAN